MESRNNETTTEINQEDTSGIGELDRAFTTYIKPIIDSNTSFLPSLDLSQFKFPDKEPDKKVPTHTVESSPSVKRDYYSTVRMLESSGRNNAKAKTSSAYGAYQFTEGTWNYYTNKLGKNYSLADRGNFAKSHEIMQAFTEDNRSRMESKLKRPVSDIELYMGHFLGPSGAVKLLSADDDEIASKLFRRASNSNKELFFVKGSKRPRTVGELKEIISNNYTKVANG